MGRVCLHLIMVWNILGSRRDSLELNLSSLNFIRGGVLLYEVSPHLSSRFFCICLHRLLARLLHVSFDSEVLDRRLLIFLFRFCWDRFLLSWGEVQGLCLTGKWCWSWEVWVLLQFASSQHWKTSLSHFDRSAWGELYSIVLHYFWHRDEWRSSRFLLLRFTDSRKWLIFIVFLWVSLGSLWLCSWWFYFWLSGGLLIGWVCPWGWEWVGWKVCRVCWVAWRGRHWLGFDSRVPWE